MDEQDIDEQPELCSSVEPELGLVTRAFAHNDPAQVFEVGPMGNSVPVAAPSKTGFMLPPMQSAKAKRKAKNAKQSSKSKQIKNLPVSNSDSESESGEEEKFNWHSNVVTGEVFPNREPTKALTVASVAIEDAKNSDIKPTATHEVITFNVKVQRTEEMQVQRLALPVTHEEQQIMETIMRNDIVILCGATGSGKTTQIPQFLYEAGFGSKEHPLFPGMIGVTQPRRVAAISMANRVGFELSLPDVVGYQIRYDKDTITSKTRIKFLTDGVLLRELSNAVNNKGGNLLLSQYSCIIVDEAHERTVGTDVLIGWLTRIVKIRNSGNIKGIGPLKLIIMSATLRVQDFTDNALLFPPLEDLTSTKPPVIEVEGRQHQVVVHYNKVTPSEDYLEDAFKKIVKIHTRLPPGGVLVFVTGQKEVETLLKKLKTRFPENNSGNDLIENEDIDDNDPEYDGPSDLQHDDFDALQNIDELDDEEEEVEILSGNVQVDEEIEDSCAESGNNPLFVLPLYSMLPSKQQLRVFEKPPDGCRLVVIATNVAETSLTIPGIRYVVDCGKVKERNYDLHTGVQNFQIKWTSKASAEQRAGRAGRMGPGHCYRLFSSAVYNNYFEQFSIPEIQRVPIEGVVLNMKNMGINKVLGFPFPSLPEKDSLYQAEKLLKHLGALDGTPLGKITPLGSQMAILPLSPRYSKMVMLAAAQSTDILHYIIAIVAGLSVGDPFIKDSDLFVEPNADMDRSDREALSRKRGKYFQAMGILAGKSPVSDIVLMLSAFGAYSANEASRAVERANFCQSYFLRQKAMEESSKLRLQLTGMISRMLDIHLNVVVMDPPSAKSISQIRQVLLSGFGDCVARLDENWEKSQGENAVPRYSTMWSDETESFVIHSSSVLFRMRPPPRWIVYDQVSGKDERFSIDQETILAANASPKVKRFLKGVTIISEQWLCEKSAFCAMGKILDQPEPQYEADSGLVKGFILPTYGPKIWKLKLSQTLIPVISESAKWFAKFLLQGQVPVSQDNVFDLLQVNECNLEQA